MCNKCRIDWLAKKRVALTAAIAILQYQYWQYATAAAPKKFFLRFSFLSPPELVRPNHASAVEQLGWQTPKVLFLRLVHRSLFACADADCGFVSDAFVPSSARAFLLESLNFTTSTGGFASHVMPMPILYIVLLKVL